MCRHGLRVSAACGLQLACDSALLSQNNTCGLHYGAWVIDCASPQAYKISVMASARSLRSGSGHNGPNTLAISPYQGKTAGESLVSQQGFDRFKRV
jgi:hypothetical protein